MTEKTADPRWGTTLADEVLAELVEASGGQWVGEEFRITGSALCALLQAVHEGGIAAAALPAGWKLAPLEPTEAMLQDGTTHCGMGMFGTDDEARKVYAAMLAAAPQPGA